MNQKKAMPATLLCDFYKLSHMAQYPEGTEVIYSTWTPRSNKHHPSTDKLPLNHASEHNIMRTIFQDGILIIDDTLANIRSVVANG